MVKRHIMKCCRYYEKWMGYICELKEKCQLTDDKWSSKKHTTSKIKKTTVWTLS